MCFNTGSVDISYFIFSELIILGLKTQPTTVTKNRVIPTQLHHNSILKNKLKNHNLRQHKKRVKAHT